MTLNIKWKNNDEISKKLITKVSNNIKPLVFLNSEKKIVIQQKPIIKILNDNITNTQPKLTSEIISNIINTQPKPIITTENPIANTNITNTQSKTTITTKIPKINTANFTISKIDNPIITFEFDDRNMEFKIINAGKNNIIESAQKTINDHVLLLQQKLEILVKNNKFSVSDPILTNSTISQPLIPVNDVLPKIKEIKNEYVQRLTKLTKLNKHIFEWVFGNKLEIPKISLSLSKDDALKIILAVYKKNHVIVFKIQNEKIIRIDSDINTIPYFSSEPVFDQF